AETSARAAVAELRQLWDAQPAVLLYGNSLGNDYNNLARVQRRMGRLDDAGASFRAGIAVFERLTKEAPRVPGYRDMLALLCNNLGALYRQRNQFGASLPLSSRAVAIYES